MKRTLKGRGRYFPGCLYSMIITMIVAVIPIFFIDYWKDNIDKFFENSNAEIFSVGFTLFFGIIYFIAVKIGEKFFNFTERKFEERTGDSLKSHKMAVFTEFISILALMVIILLGMAFISQISTEKTVPVESINGWD